MIGVAKEAAMRLRIIVLLGLMLKGFLFAASVVELDIKEARLLYRSLKASYPSLVECYEHRTSPTVPDCVIRFSSLQCEGSNRIRCSVLRHDSNGVIIEGTPQISVSDSTSNESLLALAKRYRKPLSGICGYRKNEWYQGDSYACHLVR